MPAAPLSVFKPWRLPPPFQASFSIIADSHSGAGENGHCFIYTSRFVNEPLCTGLWVSAQWDRCRRGLFVIVFRWMMLKTPSWHPYLSRWPLISTAISRTSWCTCILLTQRCNCPDGFFDWWPFFPHGCLSWLYLDSEHLCGLKTKHRSLLPLKISKCGLSWRSDVKSECSAVNSKPHRFSDE